MSEDRAIKAAKLYLHEDADMREVAPMLGVSVFTVHRDLHKRLPRVEPQLARKVQAKIKRQWVERWSRGGIASAKQHADARVETLRAIQEHTERHGVAPTHRELAQTVGIASTSSAYHRLLVLEAEGLIERQPGTYRGIRITAAGYDLLEREP